MYHLRNGGTQIKPIISQNITHPSNENHHTLHYSDVE